MKRQGFYWAHFRESVIPELVLVLESGDVRRSVPGLWSVRDFSGWKVLHEHKEKHSDDSLPATTGKRA